MVQPGGRAIAPTILSGRELGCRGHLVADRGGVSILAVPPQTVHTAIESALATPIRSAAPPLAIGDVRNRRPPAF